MPVGKYYAVKVGKTPGIYLSWDACKAMVHGFPGAVYKSFRTRAEAEAFMGDAQQSQGSGQQQSGGQRLNMEEAQNLRVEEMPKVYAFVDGSYNAATKVYGYGGFLVHDGVREVLTGSGMDEEMASMRNVAGEILGSVAAIQKAVELGLSELTVYYDYMGIEMWATGAWKRNKKGTVAYYDYVCSVKDKIKLHFVKVKGHSGVEGNEEADRLAKQAVGNH